MGEDYDDSIIDDAMEAAAEDRVCTFTCGSCGREVRGYISRCEACDEVVCDDCLPARTDMCRACLRLYLKVKWRDYWRTASEAGLLGEDKRRERARLLGGAMTTAKRQTDSPPLRLGELQEQPVT